MTKDYTPLFLAIIAGLVAAVGWAVTYILNLRKDIKSSQRTRDKEIFLELTKTYPPNVFFEMIRKSDLEKMRVFYGIWTRLENEFVYTGLQRSLNRLNHAVEVMILITQFDDPCLRLFKIFGIKTIIESWPPKNDPKSKRRRWKRRSRMLIIRRNAAIYAYEELFRLARKNT